MLARFFHTLMGRSPALKRGSWRLWYQFLAGRYPMPAWTFMNYGYAYLRPEEAGPHLAEEDEADRYFIQLYHYVAGGADVANLDVVEVGSGRGGGASYVKRYLNPRTMTGVDFSAQAVAFCTRHHQVPGLSFIEGDAEHLPLGDGQVDVVINVESSHCYGSMPAFLSQVRRVLRPGGTFLFADFRGQAEAAQLHQHLANSGMAILREEDITANVVASLDLDHERKSALIRTFFQRWLLPTFQEFAGVKGSRIHEGFRSGRLQYKYYVLQKQP